MGTTCSSSHRVHDAAALSSPTTRESGGAALSGIEVEDEQLSPVVCGAQTAARPTPGEDASQRQSDYRGEHLVTTTIGNSGSDRRRLAERQGLEKGPARGIESHPVGSAQDGSSQGSNTNAASKEVVLLRSNSSQAPHADASMAYVTPFCAGDAFGRSASTSTSTSASHAPRQAALQETASATAVVTARPFSNPDLEYVTYDESGAIGLSSLQMLRFPCL